ncbi:MAG TPA: hypothetical protein VHU92_20500 [Streptosporangiaceae bacterium]|nr:hypothetical protein [Streptosporangiaceae bacterium]
MATVKSSVPEQVRRRRRVIAAAATKGRSLHSIERDLRGQAAQPPADRRAA